MNMLELLDNKLQIFVETETITFLRNLFLLIANYDKTRYLQYSQYHNL